MERNRTFKLALLAGAAVTLQGCVAAVVPLAATGLMGAGSGSDDRDGQVAAAPVNDPSVIVERSEARTAIAAVPVEPATAPGPQSPATPEPATELAALDQSEPEPESNTMTTAFALGEGSPAMSTAEPDPLPETSPEGDQSFAEAMAPVLVAGSLDPVKEPAQESAANTVPAPEPVADLAAASPPEAEPGPTSLTATPSAPDEPAPVRIIAVDSQVALADRASTTRTLSAAEAAAALTNLEAAAQPEPAPVSLARTVPEPAPAATASMPVPPPAPPPPAQTRVAMAEPAPSVAAAPAPARTMPQPLATGEFASLINYATRQQSRSAENRASAMLADRASLMPDRADCGGADPTVLIDLDPEGDKFDPTNVPRAATGLSGALAQLRARGVKVAWISGNAQNQVLAIREALNRSGLDLDNSDQLLLMRYPEDRKQTRREDLAANACLVAIAGDTRTDFDELFEYLLNPQAAATLDPLMGNGWFLIPQPLTTERPTP